MPGLVTHHSREMRPASEASPSSDFRGGYAIERWRGQHSQCDARPRFDELVAECDLSRRKGAMQRPHRYIDRLGHIRSCQVGLGAPLSDAI
jgi:hypothetical protein